MSKQNVPSSSGSAVGFDAPRFLEFLIGSLPQISKVKLIRPPESQPIQTERTMSAEERSLIERAIECRTDLGLPFWDALFLQLSRTSIDASSILKRATQHNAHDVDATTWFAHECTEERLRAMIAALPKGRVLAICSEVLIGDGQRRHIPMLDFHCPANKQNDSLVKRIVSELGLTGFVAASGRSYHFYGCELVKEGKLVKMLAKALLFCPIIDRAWIAHQLIEGACGLRVSPGKDYPESPRIILEVG